MAQSLTHDVLILGAGLAGLRAAVEICSRLDGRGGRRIVSKVQLMRAHSVCAEGGTAAVLRTEEGDSIDLHAWDTNKGSDFLADQDVVRRFVNAIPNEIRLLDPGGSVDARRARPQSRSAPSGGTRSPGRRSRPTRPASSRLQTLYDQFCATGASRATTSSSSPTFSSSTAASRACSASTRRAARPWCFAARRC